MSPQVCGLWFPTRAPLGGRVQAANRAAKLSAWCGVGQPGGFASSRGPAWGFEHADKAGRGRGSKLAWVLLGQDQFGRGYRGVHCTWGQSSVSASHAETLPEGLNRTAPGFLGLGGGSSLHSVPAVWQGGFGGLCLGPHAPSACSGASACWR